jgi:hypothetical protein
MEKKVMEVTAPDRVSIPYDLLKKFQVEKIHIRPHPIAGVLIFPEEILAKFGHGDIAKDFDVIIVPKA